MKSKSLYIIAILVVLAGGYWYFVMDKDNKGTNEDQGKQDQSQNKDETITKELPNALEGELNVSNDKRRGNLMILLNDSDRIIYLNTSRDFSSLIGKQVSATIDGTLDDFMLVDIKAK